MLGEDERHSAANRLFEIDATMLRLADLASKIRSLIDDGVEESVVLSRRDAIRVKKDEGTFTNPCCFYSNVGMRQ
jgi:hypothetical protein